MQYAMITLQTVVTHTILYTEIVWRMLFQEWHTTVRDVHA